MYVLLFTSKKKATVAELETAYQHARAGAGATLSTMGGGHVKHEPNKHDEEEGSLFTAITTYLGYLVLIVFGHLRDIAGKLTGRSRYLETLQPNDPGFAPLVAGWENFYTRRLFNRIQDCWNRPVSSQCWRGLAFETRFSNPPLRRCSSGRCRRPRREH